MGIAEAVFVTRMPSGIPGDISRKANARVESAPLNYSLTFPTFGVPGKMASGKFVPIAASDTADSVYGMLARPYPITGVNASDPLGTSVPPTNGIANMMRAGYMTVVNNAGTPAAGGSVYVRTANPSGAKVVGGIEATPDVTVAGGVITGTGTGTIAASVADAALIVPGTWKLTLQTTSNTSLVTVIDPNGTRLKDATVGTAYTAGGLTFTITAAGTMTAADSFSPVVTASTFKLARTQFTGVADASNNCEISFNI